MICTNRPSEDFCDHEDNLAKVLRRFQQGVDTVSGAILSPTDQMQRCEHLWTCEGARLRPFVSRLKWCPKKNPSMYCCANCVEPCEWRCTVDIQNKLYTAQTEGDRYPDKLADVYNTWVALAAVPIDRVDLVLPYYKTLCFVVSRWITSWHNSHLKNSVNPYKVDLSPQPLRNPETGRIEVNPLTGEIRYLWWPDSGQCPYCLPGKTIDLRRRSRNYDGS